MQRTIWTPTLAWLAAASAAFMLAIAAPSESNVMGRLPTLTAKRLDEQRVVVLRGLSADRTLALVAFSRGQRAEIDSWVQGLQLHRDPSIPWFKMPVLHDPGTDAQRSAIERNLQTNREANGARARLLPVFTDREAFIRAAGLSGTQHASVLVLDREGKVLARAEGAYNPDKAQALRETLLAPGQ